MRAIGYVRRRVNDEDVEALNTLTVQEMAGSIGAAAGSWGQIKEIESRLRQTTTDPVMQIVEFCQSGGHQLTAILGAEVENRLLEGVETELNEDTGSAYRRQIPPEFGDEQFAGLMELIEGRHGRPALIVIPDSTHLAPDLETLVERLLYIRRSGSDAICTDMEMPDPLQNGEELLGLRGEPDWLRKRIREKIREKASRGQVLGRTPYGYRCGADGTLKPVPEEASVVEKIFEWYAGESEAESDENGPGSTNGLGMRLIARRLASENIPTRTGKPWSTATVSIILKNRVYVGTYSRYGFMVSGNHEPIIGRSLFRKAQDALMVKQRQRRLSKSEDPFLLGGLLTCGHCGHGVPGLTRRRSWRRQDDTTASKTYRYYEFYECQHRRTAKNDGDNGFKCPKWRANDLDGEVRKAIGNWDPKVVSEIRPKEMRLSLEEQLENAEKTFLSEARVVSTGRGDLENLEPFISEIKRLRQQTDDSNATTIASGRTTNGKVKRERLTRDLIADAVGSGDVNRAREALAALVDDVVVSEESVTVNPRVTG
ncbi:MAG: hypothetical protein F4X40_05825 [Chloroflexi bacterium]|nr:hypothetical protein [Chloroflexota bacterium]